MLRCRFLLINHSCENVTVCTAASSFSTNHIQWLCLFIPLLSQLVRAFVEVKKVSDPRTLVIVAGAAAGEADAEMVVATHFQT